MRKGYIFSAPVRDMSSEGAGIVDLEDGRVAFISGACVGDIVKVQLDVVKSKYATGHVLEVEQASPIRVEPVCRHHGFTDKQCGGCPWMFIRYEEQLKLKQARVDSAVTRLTQSAVVKEIVPSANELAYRNRAQFKTDGRQLGFVSFNSKTLAPIDSCPILSKTNQQTLVGLKKMLPNNNWRPKKKNQLTTIDIDEHSSLESLSINQRLGFAQANDKQNVYMRNWLASVLQNNKPKSTAVELFCGEGNFTEIILAAGYSKVVASDIYTGALGQSECANLEIAETDLFDGDSMRRLAKKAADARIAVLDPPRDGFKTCADFIKHFKKLREVIYISCDLATWQRDARQLLAAGFYLHQVQAVDQFPQTPHIELLSVFSKSKPTS